MQNPLCHAGGITNVGKIVEQDDELIALETRHRMFRPHMRDSIAVAQAVFEPLCHGNEQLIANQWSKAVVDTRKRSRSSRSTANRYC